MTRYDDETLEAAAQLLEHMGGNTIYEKAWRAGAKRIRDLKKLTCDGKKLTDKSEQICS